MIKTASLLARGVMAAVLAAVSFCIPVAAQSGSAPSKAPKSADSDRLARGKYIVEGLAVCSQCHTPRDANGAPDRAHWLEGAAVWLKSAEPSEDWPLQAPRIAGTPPGTDAEMTTLLTTGIWREGKYLRPPMPQFRMSQQDAEAVIAYLKSVKSTPQ
jgi:mono/diheme cytochrome c family protein